MNSLVNFIIAKTGHLDILCLLTSKEKFACIKFSRKNPKPNPHEEASGFYRGFTEYTGAGGADGRTPGAQCPPDLNSESK